MQSKVIFAITSQGNDFYSATTRVAVASLRISNPSLLLVVACDRDTDLALKQERDPLIKEVDEWQIELCKKNNDPYDVDQVIVYVCPTSDCDRADLNQEIKKKILAATEITPNEVKFLELTEMVGRLELEIANKAKRVVDTRPSK